MGSLASRWISSAGSDGTLLILTHSPSFFSPIPSPFYFIKRDHICQRLKGVGIRFNTSGYERRFCDDTRSYTFSPLIFQLESQTCVCLCVGVGCVGGLSCSDMLGYRRPFYLEVTFRCLSNYSLLILFLPLTFLLAMSHR